MGIHITGADTKCNGSANGSAVANVSGGLQPYVYSWFPGGSNHATISGLSAGTYTLLVTDNNGSRGMDSITIKQPAPLAVIIDSDVVQPCFRVEGGGVCGCGNSLWAIASGGTAPYSYLWPLDSNATTDTISNVCYLEFAVFVTDRNGCKGQDSIDVVTPTSPSGINEVNGESEKVKVFPNPSNGVFNMDLSAVSGQSSVEIYNMLGEKVYTKQLSTVNSPFSIDLSNQAQGVYLYRIVSESGNLVSSGKIAKE